MIQKVTKVKMREVEKLELLHHEQRVWWSPPTKLGSRKAFDLI
jgi:hypothetical protein